MSFIKYALPTLFKLEGRFSDVPGDLGGVTNFGISLRFLQSLPGLVGDLDHDGAVNVSDIKGINIGQAAALYEKYFWTPYQYDKLDSQELATRVFCATVNCGPQAPHTALQRAIRAVNGIYITDDGIIGPATIKAANSLNRDSIVPAFKAELANYYRALVVKNPSLANFLNGWLNRAYAPLVTA